MTTSAQVDAAWRLTDAEILQASRDGILPEAAAMIAINATDGDALRYRQRILVARARNR